MPPLTFLMLRWKSLLLHASRLSSTGDCWKSLLSNSQGTFSPTRVETHGEVHGPEWVTRLERLLSVGQSDILQQDMLEKELNEVEGAVASVKTRLHSAMHHGDDTKHAWFSQAREEGAC